MTKKKGKEGKRTKDFFGIDIVLRHPSYSPESMSKALSIKPQGSHAVGDKFGGLRERWTSVCARLHEGDHASEFERALSNVVLFLQEHAAFWTDFIGGNGEVDLILNHPIYRREKEGGSASSCTSLQLSLANYPLGVSA
jgi:hypothetical protein